MRIQIYKNYFKRYFDIKDWNDVPEFLVFKTVPENWVAVSFDSKEEVEQYQDESEEALSK